MGKDLDGILVVALEQAVAAPYCSGRLADAGARVIKIERPEGDFSREYDHLVKGESAYFVWLNRGKESVVLDIKIEANRKILRSMIARADVFIQNLVPGAVARLGFDLEALRREHPRLITCSISGYGEEGPYRDLKAYDLLVQAESGLSSITGNEHGMARVGVSVCDVAAGMTAFQGVLQALFARERTGEGRHIAVSLYHALADWMNIPFMQYLYGGHTLARNGLNHPTIAPYGAFTCRDGKAILISIQNEREWVVLCDSVLAHPEWVADPRFLNNITRVKNRNILDPLVQEIFGAFDREDMAKKLEAAKIAYGRVSTMDDLVNHPQNRYITVDTPSGPIRLLAPGAIFDGTLPELGRVPALGEHSAAILAEFGGA